MKKIIIAISALAVLLMSSCTKDFVTVQHNSAEPMDSYFIDESRMYESLVAAYHPLPWFDYAFGAYNDLRLVSDIMADDIYCGGSNEGDQPTLVYTHYYKATAIDHCGGIWTTAYSGVNRSCVVLEYVDGVPGMSEATKQLYKAEATILKAWYYTVLWKFWGNIPFYDENLTAPYYTDQKSADYVYGEVIGWIEDALELNALPMKASPGEEGRVTTAMAYMLYAEMVMYQNDADRYATALGYMKEIIDSTHYDLVGDFASIWLESGEWGAESIWEINYTSEGAARSWGSPMTAGGTVYPMLIGIPGATEASGFCDGWGFGPVAKHAYEMYEDGDQRRDGGILFYNNIYDPIPEEKMRWQGTGYYLLKYVARRSGTHGQIADADMNHCNNIRVYRFAETLLNAAELSLLTGADGSQYLQRVRQRAGCTASGTDQASIIEERRKEFLGEGKRYWDLVRSGLAQDVLKGENHEWRTEDWHPGKKHWPLPQSEVDKDPNLVQNVGY
jgi:hypothetical protein